jgi:hypothetical protein
MTLSIILGILPYTNICRRANASGGIFRGLSKVGQRPLLASNMRPCRVFFTHRQDSSRNL